jgi:hypothetical protein
VPHEQHEVYLRLKAGILASMDPKVLISVDVRFTTTDDPEQIVGRVQEAVRMIVGPEALEDFRWRSLPLEPPAAERTGA